MWGIPSVLWMLFSTVGDSISPVEGIRELTILGRERRPRLQKKKIAITEMKAVQLCRKHNLKDLLSE